MTQSNSARQKARQKQPKQRQEERDPLPELGKSREFESLGEGCFRRLPTQRD